MPSSAYSQGPRIASYAFLSVQSSMRLIFHVFLLPFACKASTSGAKENPLISFFHPEQDHNLSACGERHVSNKRRT